MRKYNPIEWTRETTKPNNSDRPLPSPGNQGLAYQPITDGGLETVAILAGLIRKSRAYDTPLHGKVLAVPVNEIAEVLERFTTTQTTLTDNTKQTKEG